MFKQIGQIALDGVDGSLLERMVEARNRGSDMRAPARPATGISGDQPTGGRGLDEPVAFTGRNAPRETGMKDGGVGTFTPAKLPLPWEVWTGNGVRKIGIEIATVRRRNRTMPQGSAVVISIAMYRAQRRGLLALG